MKVKELIHKLLDMPDMEQEVEMAITEKNGKYLGHGRIIDVIHHNDSVGLWVNGIIPPK